MLARALSYSWRSRIFQRILPRSNSDAGSLSRRLPVLCSSSKDSLCRITRLVGSLESGILSMSFPINGRSLLTTHCTRSSLPPSINLVLPSSPHLLSHLLLSLQTPILQRSSSQKTIIILFYYLSKYIFIIS